MKRMLLLVTLALMLAAAMALSGVAQAASPSARCQAEAETLTGLDLTGYNFIAGKNNKRGDDFTSKATEGADVFCGFGGNDYIETLGEDDIFIGGDGIDWTDINFGTFYGGAGEDGVLANYGTFYGEADADEVLNNYGTFDGGEGSDGIRINWTGGILISVEVQLPL
jgi:opacity protein-like surface antigen